MGSGAPMQAAHYLRGARMLGLPHRRFLFVVLEREAPFGVSVVELSPALLEMADEQLAYARNMHAQQASALDRMADNARELGLNY